MAQNPVFTIGLNPGDANSHSPEAKATSTKGMIPGGGGSPGASFRILLQTGTGYITLQSGAGDIELQDGP